MQERIKSSLLGLAVGDALGFPFEGRPFSALKGVDLSRFQAGEYPPGTWSDDTSLTFITAESLLQKRRLDLHDLGERFCRWLEEGYFTPLGRAIGVGRATKEAIDRFKRGIPPELCGGRGERDNGNGSLMRILPVVYWYVREEKENLLQEIHRASSLTHAHPRSLLACGLFALLIRGLFFGLEIKRALEYALEEGFSFYEKEAVFRQELPHYQRLFRLEELSAKDIRSSGYVVDTLEAVFWLLLKHSSLVEIVTAAVRLGGDTDTIAAIAGGVAGFLEAKIPNVWLKGLLERERLEKLATRFAMEIDSRTSASTSRDQLNNG